MFPRKSISLSFFKVANSVLASYTTCFKMQAICQEKIGIFSCRNVTLGVMIHILKHMGADRKFLNGSPCLGTINKRYRTVIYIEIRLGWYLRQGFKFELDSLSSLSFLSPLYDNNCKNWKIDFWHFWWETDKLEYNSWSRYIAVKQVQILPPSISTCGCLYPLSSMQLLTIKICLTQGRIWDC